jgi:exopolyphosphatase/guanosine-5'-triphosphate,3'-diphosphate pyrophosphatase
VAAIDCGTNSIRLLIADVTGGRVIDVRREMHVVRLGEGVDATGRLSTAALRRTFHVLDDYAAAIRAAGVDTRSMVMAATSATRDASNRTDFAVGVRERLGIPPTVLTGDQEARLSFDGARSALAPDTADPWLVVDIGGGSTECVIGGPGGVQAARSTDIGCVRITERRLHGDPPTTAEIRAAVTDIDAALGEVDDVVSFQSARTVVGLAGSVTTVAAIALELPSYDAEAIHGTRIAAADVHEVSLRLLAMSRQERALIPVMHPGRVDVIGAGALILDRVLDFAGVDSVTASEHDILDGLALSIAG